MKKTLFCFIVLVLILVLSGCKKIEKSYTYLRYEGKQFIKQSKGVYKHENDYVYYNDVAGKTIITMSFSDVKIELSGRDPIVIYPDGCAMFLDVTNGPVLTYGPSNPHKHEFSKYGYLTFEQVENSDELRIEEQKKQILPLIFLIFILVYTSFFVFKPGKIRSAIKHENKIFSMYKEPLEPTDFNISLKYINCLILFIASIVIIIIILRKYFF